MTKLKSISTNKDYGERTCLVCGMTFSATYPGQITCSVACRSKRRKTLLAQSNAIRWQSFKGLKARVTELEAELDFLKKENTELQQRLALCGVAM